MSEKSFLQSQITKTKLSEMAGWNSCKTRTFYLIMAS